MASRAKLQLTTQQASIWAAVKKGDAKRLKEALAPGAGVDFRGDNDGSTPLCLAAERGAVDVVRMLLEAKANVDLARSDGYTPLLIASDNGHTRVIVELVAAGANVNLPKPGGESALLLAAQFGHVEAIEALLAAKADVNLVDKEGYTPLFLAAQEGFPKAVEVLLRAGADPSLSLATGGTALEIARHRRHAEIVRLLDPSGKAEIEPVSAEPDAGRKPRVRRRSGRNADPNYIMDSWPALASPVDVDVLRQARAVYDSSRTAAAALAKRHQLLLSLATVGEQLDPAKVLAQAKDSHSRLFDHPGELAAHLDLLRNSLTSLQHERGQLQRYRTVLQEVSGDVAVDQVPGAAEAPSVALEAAQSALAQVALEILPAAQRLAQAEQELAEAARAMRAINVEFLRDAATKAGSSISAAAAVLRMHCSERYVTELAEAEAKLVAQLADAEEESSSTEGPRIRKDPTKKKTRGSVPAAVKSKLWHNYYGEAGSAKCYVCNQRQIYREAFEAAHVISRHNGGDDHIQNLRPSCSLCNQSIGTMNLEEYKKLYGI